MCVFSLYRLGGSFVQPQSKDSVDVIAELLGLESSDLEAALTGRIMTPGKAGGKGTVYRLDELSPFTGNL